MKYTTAVLLILLASLFSACASAPDLSAADTASGLDQPAAEQATALPTSEAEPSETAPVEVDLSSWNLADMAVFSADGSLLAVDSDEIYIYDSVSLQQISHIPETFSILDMAFSADGKVISVAYRDYDVNAFRVQLFDLTNNTEISNLVVLPLRDGYQESIWGLLSPDGKTLALHDFIDGILKLWDVASGEPLHELTIRASCLAFSPDGRTLAICDEGTNSMMLWDVSSGKEIRSFDMLKSNQNIESMNVAFSADGNVLAVAATYDYVLDDSFTVTLIDLSSGGELVSFDVPVAASMSGNPLFAMAFSNDGSMLASGSAAGIKIWDTASGEELLTIEYAVENNSFAQYELAFWPDDTKLIFSSEWNDQVIMWDVATGEKLAP
jgi:WD40 repeat protein